MNLVLENGTAGRAAAFTLLLNEAMKGERARALAAAPDQRTDSHKGHANGFKSKTHNSRLGRLTGAVPQLRGEVDFWLSNKFSVKVEPASGESGGEEWRGVEKAVAG